MKNKIVASCLIVTLSIIAFAQPAVLGQDVGQPRFGTWEAVKAIRSGERLEVKLKSGKTVKGELTRVSDTEIALGSGSNVVTTGRNDVQRVSRVIGKSSNKPILVGALIGAGVGGGGMAVAAAADDTAGTEGELTPIVIGVVLAGAAVGALVGSMFRKKKKLELIYEAR